MDGLIEESAMKKLFGIAAAALLVAAASGGIATAQTSTATATADLNIRSGPGPHFESIGFIASGDSATIAGCLEASKWCRVQYNGVEGWSYSDYLTAELSGEVMVLTDRYPELGLQTVTYSDTGSAGGGAVAGTASGAVVGALIGGPVGAAVGGTVGAASGATAGAIVDPPESARSYVRANPLETVILEGEVVVGAGLPDGVTLQTIPDFDYRYVYLNGQPVLVDPGTRRIVYVLR